MKSAHRGRRIRGLGGLREPGGKPAALHADLAPSIVDSGIDLLFSCGEMMAHLYDALPAGGRGFHAETSLELAPRVASAVRAGDVITVKGSHSMRMDLVIDALRALEESAP